MNIEKEMLAPNKSIGPRQKYMLAKHFLKSNHTIPKRKWQDLAKILW